MPWKNPEDRKAWRKKNAEKLATELREWRKDNRDRVVLHNRTYRDAHPERQIIFRAKQRAKRLGVEFSLDENDVSIPEVCPLLGIRLQVSVGRSTDNSPSLDRLDNTKGYIKGNVWIISHKANTIKSSATLDELESLVLALRQKLTS